MQAKKLKLPTAFSFEFPVEKDGSNVGTLYKKTNQSHSMKNIPAIPFMKSVRHFALAKGLKFFTWKDQAKAITIYKTTLKNPTL